MPATHSISSLISRLEKAGVDKAFVRDVVLPSWWDDSIATSQPGFLYAATIVSSHLGIPLKVVADETKAIALPNTTSAKFKHNKGLERTDFAWANSVALAVAKQVVSVVNTPLKPLPSDPKKIRQAILARGAGCVSLKALLTYLWEHGIPVVHVCSKPKKQKKMAGLAARISGRPIIVCCKNDSLSALMLFLVAHELGHIVMHLSADGSVVDEKINADATDTEEKEANDFAATLITGSAGVYKTKSSGNITAERLAKIAISTGEKDHVDPCVVAMSVAHGRGFYPVGVKACTIIEGEKANASSLIRDMMSANINLNELPDEDEDFVRKACGCGDSHAVPVGY